MISILSPNTLILHGVICSGESVALPREFSHRRIADVWKVLNECAVRVTGPIDNHNAERTQQGQEWHQNGDRLSYHPVPARAGVSEDLLVTFEGKL